MFYFHFSSGGNVQQGIVIRRSLRAGLDEEDLSRFERDPLRYSLHYSFLNVSCWCDGSPSMLLYGFGVQAGFPRPHTLFQIKLLPKTLWFWIKKNIPQKGRKRFFYGSNMVDNGPKRAKRIENKIHPLSKKVTPRSNILGPNPYYVLCDRRRYFCSILYLWNIYDRRWNLLVQRSKTSPRLL